MFVRDLYHERLPEHLNDFLYLVRDFFFFFSGQSDHEHLQEHSKNFSYFVTEIDLVSVGFSMNCKSRRGKMLRIYFSSPLSRKDFFVTIVMRWNFIKF